VFIVFTKEIVRRIAKRIVNWLAERGVSAALMLLKRGESYNIVVICILFRKDF
jgi:hypothetical protein